MQPTRPQKALTLGERHWSFINHLAVDHLGVCSHTKSVLPLRAFLKNYNPGHNSLDFAIEALHDLTVEKNVAPFSQKRWKSFVPLLSVTIKMDDHKANTQGFFFLYLLLSEFFKKSAPFNTLVETRLVGLSDNLIKTVSVKSCDAPSL